MIVRMGSRYAFKCQGCGTTAGGFGSEKEAKVALRLHQIGCKKS